MTNIKVKVMNEWFMSRHDFMFQSCKLSDLIDLISEKRHQRQKRKLLFKWISFRICQYGTHHFSALDSAVSTSASLWRQSTCGRRKISADKWETWTFFRTAVRLAVQTFQVVLQVTLLSRLSGARKVRPNLTHCIRKFKQVHHRSALH